MGTRCSYNVSICEIFEVPEVGQVKVKFTGVTICASRIPIDDVYLVWLKSDDVFHEKCWVQGVSIM